MMNALERSSRVGVLALALGVSSPALFAAENLALSGAGILGLKDSLDSSPGTEVPFYNAGSLSYINDGDVNSRVDTYNGNGTQTVSYVGIYWEQPLETPVVHLDLTLALFGNGGWFGVNQIGPSAGGTLADEHLVQPRVEVTTDGGATWETVASTSDYYLALRGSPIGAPNSATARFTLAEAAAGLSGIRIIGTEGGTVSGGFLGVFELAVLPAGVDSDADEMEDDWETTYELSVGTDDADGDADGDGRSNLQEYTAKTNPKQTDTDGDGLSDGVEVNQHGTHPQRLDTDGDTLSDGHELTTLRTNPLAKDTDGDGYGDGVEVTQGTDPTNPENYPENLAIIGQGILGGKPAIDGGPETETHHANSGSPANINDGNLNSRVDTYGPDFPVSFVGIVWSAPLSKPVAQLDLTLALFSNGGWFGANGIDPGTGGQLAAEHLVDPRVEVTTDGGLTWNVVAHTSDYLAALTGHGIGGGQYPNPNPVTATFTLAELAVGITGIRLVGTDGGTAGNGFLGVFELTARTPVADTDNDGMPDSWERINGLNVGTNDAAGDSDSDGLSNLEEFAAETDPRAADSDGDGLSDGPEIKTHMTDPLRVDTDGDALRDSDEINTHRTNPLLKDTDNDRFSDFVEIGEGTDPNSAGSIPNNIAPSGRAILGRKPSIDSDTASEIPVFNAGIAANINDGNLDTRVDNYGRVEPVSFVGIIWDEPVTNTVIDLELTHALFSNGGWFGAGGADPGAGGLLTDQHVVEPRVEITTDGGQTWHVVFYSSDYLSALINTGIGGGAFPNPNRAAAKFTVEPLRDINGIRLVGTHGGTAAGGFLGLFELAVHTDMIQAHRLFNISSAGGELRFEFQSQVGVSHVVQFKTSLSDANWQTHTTIAGDGARKQVIYNIVGTQRIFRVSNQRIP